MKHRLNFITGVAMLIVAGTFAVIVFVRDPDSAGGGGEGEAAGPATVVTRPSVGGRAAANAAGAVEVPRFGVRVAADAPDRPRLEALAKQVEAHALARLERLTEELDLTVDQQRRIFPKLVQGSQSYDPSMQIVGADPHAVVPGGGAGVGGFGDLAAELDPAQQDELVEDSLDDLLLWREIIANLERQLEQQTGVVETPEAPEPDAPEPATGGERNLFDLVPPE